MKRNLLRIVTLLCMVLMVTTNYAAPASVEADGTYTEVIAAVVQYDPVTWEADTIEGVEWHYITVKSADGATLAYFEIIVSDDAESLAGEYPLADNSVEAGTMNHGWDGSAWGIGFQGSYYVADDTKMYLDTGTVSIADVDGVLTITASELSATSDFVTYIVDGAISLSDIPEYQEPAEVESDGTYTDLILPVVQYDPVTWEADTVEGVKWHYITVINSDDSVIAYLEIIVSDDAESLAGDYILAESSIEAGTMNHGWDGSAWGWGFNGSYYVVNDARMYLDTAGIVSIADVDGVLTITGSELRATSDFVTYIDDGTISLSDLAKYEPTPVVEVSEGTYTDNILDVVQYDPVTWEADTVEGVKWHYITVKNTDDSVIAYFEIIVSDDTESLAGDYIIAESSIEAGTMNHGWDGSAWGWGFNGSYYVVSDTRMYLDTAGIVTIADVDGVLTITASEVGGTSDFVTYIDDGAFSLSNLSKIETTAIKESNNLTFEVYPNPTMDYIHVRCDQGSTIELYSVSGILLKAIRYSGEFEAIDLSGYTDGLYFVRVSNNDNTLTKKIIKQ